MPRGKAVVKKRKPVATPEIRFTAEEIVLRKVDDLIPFPNNPKIHTAAQIDAIAANITAFGFDQPILIDETDTILKGHGRQLAARKAGLDLVPTIKRKGLSVAQKWAVVISDNALPAMTGFDNSLLRIGLTTLAKLDFDLKLTGFDDVQLVSFISGVSSEGAVGQSGSGSLAAKFGIPPFSVLNAREGWWQDRKRAWLSLGIRSELGRGDTGVNSPHEGHGMADGLVAIRDKQKKKRKANAIPGGGAMPLDRERDARRNATPGG